MKLIVAGLLGAATCGVLYSIGTVQASGRPRPPPRMGALQLCHVGGVELIDERCNATGGCAKQSVRLAWNRGEGVLFEGDSTGEQELRRIHAPELGRLLTGLSALDPLGTDSERVCGREGCPPTDRALTITTDCGGAGSATFTFMRARPAWDRVRSECAGRDGRELAECTAQRAWHAAFATQLATRFGAVFHQLRETARGG